MSFEVGLSLETVASRFQNLRDRLDAQFMKLMADSKFAKLLFEGEFDRDLLAIYLIETYHYTSHNARNQALVGVRSNDISDQYRRFCFHHAEEETGHENMALHDLLSLTSKRLDEIKIPAPLLGTETLIAYLYWISANGNPIQRLGYSFWAESCYKYINPFIELVREKFSLKPTQMTFFVAHAEIDQDHAAEVEAMIASQCRTEDDWRAVERVMHASLDLTMRMTEDVVDAYLSLKANPASSPYRFLLD